MAPRLLIVDDDRDICALVKTFLEKSEFQVDVAYDVRMAKDAVNASSFDLLLLDVMLPGQSGLDLCRDIRSRSDVPIIMLTAMGQLADKVAGLELGADDYIVKPFEPRELLARARAAVRRRLGGRDAPPAAADQLMLDGLKVDIARRMATGAYGKDIPLTFAEFELLLLLLSSPNTTVPRSTILQAVFGRSEGLYDRSADVLMSRLRKKLQIGGVSLTIESVRTVGYMLVGQVKRC